MRQIVLATQNKGKIKEFERLLAEYAGDIQVLGLAEFPNLPDVQESGSTFVENSLLKSREVSEFTGLPAIADDSGLCIDYLNGEPGIYSARWSGVHGDDQANIEKALGKLIGVTYKDRGAQFRCAVSLVFPRDHKNFGLEIIEEGELRGSITLQPRGSAGFGYDPIFQPEGYELTLGEFVHGEKDKISHRGRAMRKIAPRLIETI